MNKLKEKVVKRERRRRRIRGRVAGGAERPRLAVFRSERHVYCQLVDDNRGVALAAASTLSPELRATLSKTSNVAAAREVGRLIARKAVQLGVRKVVFDRGGFLYHGRIKALAEGAREIFKEAGEIGF